MSRILVDGHGGDHAPGIVIEALQSLVKQYGEQLTLGIVGNPEILEPALQEAGLSHNVELVPASE
ncbi:MAG: phosphate acyltransferase, partial [Mariprofundaceae bacterium]|nr:phosphate acyltransferase [Mariprofundaceae bacterium]